MGSTFVIALTAWVAFNAVVFAALARRARVRRDPHPPPRPRRRSYGASIDGYGALLLTRVLTHTCRVVGAPQGCLLLRDRAQPGVLVPVAARGLDDTLIGHRIAMPGDGFAVVLTAGAGVRPAARGVALPVVRATVGDCGYLWAAAGPAAELGDGQMRLMSDLADQCARALDDVEDAAALDESIGRALALLCEDDDPARAGRHAALARAVAERLGMDTPASIELDMAARVQHAVAVAPAEAVRALPGFAAVGLVLRFARERWDGGGPHGLRGQRIPLGSRILAVCAAFDGDIDRALRAIQASSGTAFDPAVVTALSHELLGPVPDLASEVAGWAEGDRLFAELPG